MARPRRGDDVELHITGVDEKGRGVGFLEGYTALVRGAIPGDLVKGYVRKVKNRQKEVEVRKQELVDSEKKRIEPLCTHFGTCGGCVWQDVVYEDQVQVKLNLVKRCLQNAQIDVEVDTPLVVEDPFFYRNKMEFSFGVSKDQEIQIGLHVPGRFDHVFDLEACYLQSPLSNEIVAFVRDFVVSHNLSVYHLKTHEGLLRFLTIREGKRTDQTMVILTTSGDDFEDIEALAGQLQDTFPQVTCFIHSINKRKAQVAFGDEEIAVSKEAHIEDRLGDFTFEISPTSFFQTNTYQAEKLYQRVVDIADPQPDDKVLDLYCGMGGISFFLAKRVNQVLGIEVSESAVRDALKNSAENNIDNCAFMAGQAEDLMGQLAEGPERFDLVVTDPPRAGMHPKAMGALIEMRPKKIVYVSCNPQALANDLRVLVEAGYRADYCQLVDMFPHTPHCEVLVRIIDTK